MEARRILENSGHGVSLPGPTNVHNGERVAFLFGGLRAVEPERELRRHAKHRFDPDA
jgi:hypothetical protein